MAGENQQNQQYALKLLDLWLMRPDEYELLECKFRQEFETGRIKSSNIVQSYNAGHIEGNPYITMDYCPNGTLATRIKDFTKEGDYQTLGLSILQGLKALHKQGVIHRDLKPENVLFDVNHNPKLADFGIAGYLNKRLTSRNFIGMVSQVWGTPLYSPPEQLDHGKAFKLTAPTMDIFSFGVLMYEVISGGRHPFGQHQELLDQPSKFVERVKAKSYTPLNQLTGAINSTWLSVINRCLEPKPNDRFASVEEILTELHLNALPDFSDKRYPSKEVTGVCLKVMQGDEVGSLYTLNHTRTNEDKEFTLGWSDDEGKVVNDIPIKESRSSYISRKHATIFYKDGQWFIKDGQVDKETWTQIYSLNGTFINYKPLEQNATSILKNGDIITIGDTILKFQIV